jgi:hypothetical protein
MVPNHQRPGVAAQTAGRKGGPKGCWNRAKDIRDTVSRLRPRKMARTGHAVLANFYAADVSPVTSTRIAVGSFSPRF